jgi:hypothetical protein
VSAPPAPPAVAADAAAAELEAAAAAAAAPALPPRPVEDADPDAPRDEILAEARAANNRFSPATAAALASLTREQSYSQHYDALFSAGHPLPIKTPIPKPSRSAQLAAPDAKPIALSDVGVTKKVPLFFGRSWNSTDWAYVAVMVAVHGLALLAPFTFSWGNVALFLGSYFVTGCLGITLSFHRQLSHRSFQTPKWLEYALAYCGVLAVQVRVVEILEQACGGARDRAAPAGKTISLHAPPIPKQLTKTHHPNHPNTTHQTNKPTHNYNTTGRPHRVGLFSPLPPPPHRHTPGPTLPL